MESCLSASNTRYLEAKLGGVSFQYAQEESGDFCLWECILLKKDLDARVQIPHTTHNYNYSPKIWYGTKEVRITTLWLAIYQQSKAVPDLFQTSDRRLEINFFPDIEEFRGMALLWLLAKYGMHEILASLPAFYPEMDVLMRPTRGKYAFWNIPYFFARNGGYSMLRVYSEKFARIDMEEGPITGDEAERTPFGWVAKGAPADTVVKLAEKFSHINVNKGGSGGSILYHLFDRKLKGAIQIFERQRKLMSDWDLSLGPVGSDGKKTTVFFLMVQQNDDPEKWLQNKQVSFDWLINSDEWPRYLDYMMAYENKEAEVAFYTRFPQLDYKKGTRYFQNVKGTFTTHFNWRIVSYQLWGVLLAQLDQGRTFEGEKHVLTTILVHAPVDVRMKFLAKYSGLYVDAFSVDEFNAIANVDAAKREPFLMLYHLRMKKTVHSDEASLPSHNPYIAKISPFFVNLNALLNSPDSLAQRLPEDLKNIVFLMAARVKFPEFKEVSDKVFLEKRDLGIKYSQNPLSAASQSLAGRILQGVISTIF